MTDDVHVAYAAIPWMGICKSIMYKEEDFLLPSAPYAEQHIKDGDVMKASYQLYIMSKQQQNVLKNNGFFWKEKDGFIAFFVDIKFP
jgi:hypothetical protein